MSLRISGDKLALRRTANLPASFANFTICLFAKLGTARSTFTSNLLYTQVDAPSTRAEQILVKGGSGLALIGADSYEANVTSTVATLTAGGASGVNWFFTAMRGAAAGAGGLRFYHKPISGSIVNQSITNSPGAHPMTVMQLGDAPFAAGDFGVPGWWFDGYIAHVKIYDRALSDAEVETEAGQGSPVSTAGLLSYHAFTAAAVADALLPQQGTGSFSAWTSNPTMSTDNPDIAANPAYSGTVTIPGKLILAAGGGSPLFSRLLSMR